MPNPALVSRLQTVLREFNPNSQDSFKERCDRLIKQYGFTAFRDTFDYLATRPALVSSNKNIQSALESINQLIIEQTADYFSGLMLRGAKTQAEEAIKALTEDENIRAQAEELARVDNTKSEHPVKVKIKNKVAHQMAAEVANIENSTLSAEEKAAKIREIELSGERRQQAISEVAIPSTYYIDKARIKRVKDAKASFNANAAEFSNALIAYVEQDLLSTASEASTDGDLFRLRARKFERYILIAEKLVDTNRSAVAFFVFSSLLQETIYRLHTTKSVLSDHAKSQYQRLETLFSPIRNFANFMELYGKAAAKGDYVAMPIIGKWLEFLDDSTIGRDEEDSLTVTNPGMEKIIAACRHIQGLPEFSSNLHLIEDISAAAVPKTEAQENELFAQSRALEPDIDKMLSNCVMKGDDVSDEDIIDALNTLKVVYGVELLAERFDKFLEKKELSTSQERRVAVINSFFVDPLLESQKTARNRDLFKAAYIGIERVATETITANGDRAAKACVLKTIEQETKEKREQMKQVWSVVPPHIERVIDTWKKNKEKEIAERSMPLDYYIEQTARDRLAILSKQLAEQAAVISQKVTEDISRRPSVDGQTRAVERYLLVAKKAMDSGDMQTVLHLYDGFSSSRIKEMATIKDSLSGVAKKQLKLMESLFEGKNNFYSLKQYCERKGGVYPLDLRVHEFLMKSHQQPIALDEHGLLLKGAGNTHDFVKQLLKESNPTGYWAKDWSKLSQGRPEPLDPDRGLSPT